MKKIILLIVSFITIHAFGQDKIFYDFNGIKVKTFKSAYYYEIETPDSIDTNKMIVDGFYCSGQKKSLKSYNASSGKLHGAKMEWYKNGQVHKSMMYVDSKLNGTLLTFWENGQLKRNDLFEDGTFIDGKVWNYDGVPTRHYDFMILPQFPGGVNKLMQYLVQNVRYPKQSQQNPAEGRVLVQFVVEKDGKISNVKVVKHMDTELDAEAKRVVKKMPKWTPGLEDGEKTRVMYVLPINFKLE